MLGDQRHHHVHRRGATAAGDTVTVQLIELMGDVDLREVAAEGFGALPVNRRTIAIEQPGASQLTSAGGDAAQHHATLGQTLEPGQQRGIRGHLLQACLARRLSAAHEQGIQMARITGDQTVRRETQARRGRHATPVKRESDGPIECLPRELVGHLQGLQRTGLGQQREAGQQHEAYLALLGLGGNQ